MSAEEPGARRGAWWRRVVVLLCLVLVAVLSPLAVVATWARDEVSDTDQFVDTMSPLARDRAVQDAVIDRISTEILSRLDVEAVTDEAVQALTDRGVPPRVAASLEALGAPLAQGVEGFVRGQVTELVRSDEFAEAWDDATRQAHSQMVAVLTGEGNDAVEVEGNTVRLQLAVIIDAVKARLVDSGFTLAERLPPVSAEFTVFRSSDITKAQSAFRLLEAAARILPVLTLLLLVVAVLIAPRRRRTLVVGALVVAASMMALGAALTIFRGVYLDAVPSDQLPADAAAVIYDTLVRYLRQSLRTVLVLALLTAVVGWVIGATGPARSLRRGAARVIGSARSGADGVGLSTGRFGLLLGRYRTQLRVMIASAVMLAYAFAEHPTAGWTLRLVVGALLVLLVLEFLARDPVPVRDDADHAVAGPSG